MEFSDGLGEGKERNTGNEKKERKRRKREIQGKEKRGKG